MPNKEAKIFPMPRRRHFALDRIPARYLVKIRKMLESGRTYRDVSEATRAWDCYVPISSICRYWLHARRVDQRAKQLAHVTSVPDRVPRRKHFRVDEFPPATKVFIDQALRSGLTYREIASHLGAAGYPIGIASVCRYAQTLRQKDEDALIQGNTALPQR